jgi:NAD(P)-dependent dehydrogenase (short-subunit alcohol dehydrogenase family)
MSGRVCVVTGASGGMGKATAVELARRGATAVLVVRSPGRGEAARSEIERATGSRDVHLVLADLSRQADVRRAADEMLARFPAVHVLVNNAATHTWRRRETPDGIEQQWAVNHLAPFLLTNLLLPRMIDAAPARVVTVSSNAHMGVGPLRWDDLEMGRGRYRGFRQYGYTKLANVLFTRELARRTAGAGVTANALHPGVVATDLLLNGAPPLKLFRRWMRTPEQGAATAVHLATSPEVEGVTGEYFIDERPVALAGAATDDEAARRLWSISERMTGFNASSTTA